MQTLNVDYDYQVRVIGKTLNLPEQEDIILNSISKRKWDFLVLSRRDFRMIWRCHAIFTFSIEWERLPALLWYFFFRKCHSKSTWLELCSKFFLNNYKKPWQKHLKDTIQLKILRTWIIIGVKLAQRHLTYNCILLFLPNTLSF